MAEMIAMPKLGFDMAEGTLVRWVIKEGESVTKGAVLAEIETDKATVEVESTAGGILYKQMVDEGAVVPVGSPIAVIAAPGEEVKDIPSAGEAAPKAEKPAEAETASRPVETVEKSAAPAPPPVEAAAEPLPTGEAGMLKASPIARRMAQEKNLDLHQITGSGPEGRIVKKDIEQALEVKSPAVAVKPVPPAIKQTAAPTPQAIAWVPGAAIPADEHLPLEKLRTIIGKRMTESKQQVPHFYITSAYDVAPLLELRRQVNSQLPEGEKLSVNDFIVKAVALALRQFPNLNASLSGNEIIRHGHVNVGVAVALDNGLMTIVCRDADQKPLRMIGQEVREMVARARSGKVRTDDIEGSTFSISNLGMFDVEHFIAIINPPETGILAVGSAMNVPVVVDGEVKVGMRMKLTLSTDHRVTDGAEGARFMQALAEFIQNPWRLLL